MRGSVRYKWTTPPRTWPETATKKPGFFGKAGLLMTRSVPGLQSGLISATILPSTREPKLILIYSLLLKE